MAYVPVVWSYREVISSTKLNQMTDNDIAIKAVADAATTIPLIGLSMSGTVTAPTADTALPWAVEVVKYGGMTHVTPEGVTVPRTGIYLVSLYAEYVQTAGNPRDFSVKKNGVALATEVRCSGVNVPNSATYYLAHLPAFPVLLAAGDILTVWSTGGVIADMQEPRCRFSVVWQGAQ